MGDVIPLHGDSEQRFPDGTYRVLVIQTAPTLRYRVLGGEYEGWVGTGDGPTPEAWPLGACDVEIEGSTVRLFPLG